MSRLIDADALLQEFETENVAHRTDLWHIDMIKRVIEKAPIAYDVEKVVADLQKEIEWAENHGKSIDFRNGRLSGLRTAIRISRNGGAT